MDVLKPETYASPPLEEIGCVPRRRRFDDRLRIRTCGRAFVGLFPHRSEGPGDRSKGVRLPRQSDSHQHGTARSLGVLALIKAGRPADDPKVEASVAAIRTSIQTGSFGSPTNYNVAATIIFLVELDPVKYRYEIETLLKVHLSRQEGHGGWSYWPGEGAHSRQEGDSSMTQYGTLALGRPRGRISKCRRKPSTRREFLDQHEDPRRRLGLPRSTSRRSGSALRRAKSAIRSPWRG